MSAMMMNDSSALMEYESTAVEREVHRGEVRLAADRREQRRDEVRYERQ